VFLGGAWFVLALAFHRFWLVRRQRKFDGTQSNLAVDQQS
jgi:hypothetical protein